MIPMIEKEVVDRKKWFEKDEFYDQFALASSAPGPWVWPIRSDPPLFISENCPHAAATGACPHDGRCGYTGELLRNRAGETVQIIARHCRFYILGSSSISRRSSRSRRT